MGGRGFSHYEAVDDETRARLLPLIERQRTQIGKPLGAILEGEYAYVLVPGYSVGLDQVPEAAPALFELVARLAQMRPKGWIIDLSLNSGGNVYPMLLGLSQILGDSTVGGTEDAEGVLIQSLRLRAGLLYKHDELVDRETARLPESRPLANGHDPVVVLLSETTRSSEQATAFAFQKRLKPLLLGEPTSKGRQDGDELPDVSRRRDVESRNRLHGRSDESTL